MLPESAIALPGTVGSWTRSDETRRVTSETIFDYMDGAGELYIGYRFRHMDVFRYLAAGEDEILVELYRMGSSDDAFGLLSVDWGGEVVDLGGPGGRARRAGADRRALYGAGLLRIWSDDLYARVMAYRETKRSRNAVLQIGRAIVAGRRSPPVPKLLSALPASVNPGLTMRADRTCYFRSHLVLNSAYFLSSANILELGQSTEAATTVYATAASRRAVRLVLVRYTDPGSAVSAISRFEKVYLSEKRLTAPARTASGNGRFWKIEDGWLGYRRVGRILVLAFECPERETSALLIDAVVKRLNIMEARHE